MLGRGRGRREPRPLGGHFFLPAHPPKRNFVYFTAGENQSIFKNFCRFTEADKQRSSPSMKSIPNWTSATAVDLASRIQRHCSSVNASALITGASVFTGSSTFLLGTVVIQHERLRHEFYQRTLDEKQSLLTSSAHLWVDELSDLTASAQVLKEDPRLLNTLATPSPANKVAAQQALLHFASLGHHVRQVRLLDRNGLEKARINSRPIPTITPDNQLQDKSKEIYFKEIAKLPANSIYFSNTDLNREHGAIEHPLKPTTRIAQPIKDRAGTTIAGYLIVNFEANALLETLDAKFVNHTFPGIHTIIVNQRGNFVKHYQRNLEWAPQRQELNRLLQREESSTTATASSLETPSRCQRNLACSEPALWERMQRERRGELKDRGGAWRWIRVDTSDILKSARSTRQTTTEKKWWFITHIPMASMQQKFNKESAGLRLIGAIALVISGAVGVAAGLLRRHSLQYKHELERQRSIYALLAENAADVVFSLQDGRVAWVSKSIDNYCSAQSDQWIKRRALACVHPNQRRQALQIIGHLAPHQSTTLRLQVELESGRYDWIELQAKHVTNNTSCTHQSLVTGSFHLINEQIRQEKHVAYLAETDELTGLSNRRAILRQAKQSLLANNEQDSCLALLFVDLDNFKAINDTYGHADGDLVLRATATRIRGCVREGDSVGRMGGDEILVLLNGIRSFEHAMVIAHKIQRACSQPVQSNGTAILTSVSVGVAMARQGESFEDLQACADQALYKAKALGRNRVACLNDDLLAGRDSHSDPQVI